MSVLSVKSCMLGVISLIAALMTTGCAHTDVPLEADFCDYNLMWGVPASTDAILCRGTFVVGYNNTAKLPEWVTFRVTRGQIDGEFSGMHSFRQDEELPLESQARAEDFDGTGFHRAHLAPPSLVGSDLESAKNSFRMSNVVPQAPGLHSGSWIALEQIIRYYVVKYGDVYVVNGVDGYTNAFTLPGHGNNRYLTETSKVRIPRRFYSAVYIPRLRAGFAVLLPNADLGEGDIFRYALSVAELERQAEVNVFPLMEEPLAYRVKNSQLTPRQLIAVRRAMGDVRQLPNKSDNPFYAERPPRGELPQ